jgi:hypothetical protein
VLPAVLSTLDAAAGRGLPVADLRGRMSRRSTNLARYADAYRSYVGSVDGLEGVTLAPFAVLATDGATHAGRDPGWHLALATGCTRSDNTNRPNPSR